MEICARLDHPDVVGLVDYGDDDGSMYSVFELVPGRTLAQEIAADGALTLVEAIGLMRQLLEVLVHAHGHGVIHRDLKPSNLMVFGEDQRRLKVLDFGISAIPSGSAVAGPTRLTLSNEMVGTPAYAAPEQLRGDAPTAKTDLYSWGLVLLECLTGVNPIAGASIGEIFQNQLSPAPVQLPARLRGHPLGGLLSWVLEKNPLRRASSATDVLTRLVDVDVDDLGDPAGYFVDATPDPLGHESDADLMETTTGAAASGERRQITALCCHLAFACAGPVEPELLEAYRGDLFALCDATVQEFGGVAIAGLGDLALYYFGLTQAKDTDARMATRAALELSARVRTRSAALSAQSQVRLTMQAGLHTGLLTTGDRRSRHLTTHGNVAAVAQALAQRGTVHAESSISVSDAFRALAMRHALFAAESGDRAADTIELGWRDTPMHVHRLTGESLSDVLAEGAAPMIGRDDELAALLELWQRSHTQGRIALLAGEAGIGKSRLAHEFRRRTIERAPAHLRLRFLPEMKHVALGPVLELVMAELGFGSGPRPSCEELAAGLRAFPDIPLERAVALLCSWQRIPLRPPFELLTVSPQKQRALLCELLVAIVMHRLQAPAGLIFVEDLHWADPSSLDWLGLLFAALERRGGFALLTARPEFQPRWTDLEVHTIELGSLDAESLVALVSALPGLDGAEPLVAQIVARADGIPLYAEELARVLFAQLSDAPEGAELEVPMSLQQLLMSRLDALGSARETAHYAAAIGREFDVELLSASILGKDEATVLADLDHLVSVGIASTRRQLGHHAYLFRHALVRDAAYLSMTSAGRIAVHDAIARELLSKFTERVDARPDLVALHLELAGRALECQRYWLAAGQRALAQSGHEEAITFIRRGLGQCPSDGGGPAHTEIELELLNALGAALIAKRGYGAPGVGEVYERANTLLESATTTRTFMTRWGLFNYTYQRSEHARAIAIADELEAQASDALEHMTGTSASCRALMAAGRFADAIKKGAEIKPFDDPSRHREFVGIFGEDPYSSGLTFQHFSLVYAGEVDRAAKESAAVLEFVRGLALPNALALVLGQSAHLHLVRGLDEGQGHPDMARVFDYTAQMSAIAASHDFPFWHLYATFLESAARCMSGDVEAVPVLAHVIGIWKQAGSLLLRPQQLALLGEGLRQAGQLDEARAVLDEGLSFAHEHGERYFEPELLRVRARLEVDDPGSHEDAALEDLEQAIQIASEQGAQLPRLRAALDLYQLRPGRGRAPLRAAVAWWADSGQGRDLGCVRRSLALLANGELS